MAHTYDASVPVDGYILSEKLDGMRACWRDGALWTRTGEPIVAPSWFVAGLPATHALDGELHAGRQHFGQCMSAVRKKRPDDAEWRRITYSVFDCPSAPGGIVERLRFAADLLSSSSPWVVVHPYEVCAGHAHVADALARVCAQGGEGLMLRHPTAPFRAGRTHDLLKVKTFLDDEALVVEHVRGKGKHSERMGSLTCSTREGRLFGVGSGFSDAERANPPPLHSVITVKFFETTKHGVPRFPTFVRVRPDVDPASFGPVLATQLTAASKKRLSSSSAVVSDGDVPLVAPDDEDLPPSTTARKKTKTKTEEPTTKKRRETKATSRGAPLTEPAK